MIKIKYGNANTFFIPGRRGGLLIDTDYAGTMPTFYKAIKSAGLRVTDIAYVLPTHYHPDHMGLVGQLTEQGVKLLLVDSQKEAVHLSDGIFARDRVPYTPVKEAEATVISCSESRVFLSAIGICGEIICTPSHSNDSVSLVLDDGSCFVGDLEPLEYLDAYEEQSALKKDWEQLKTFRPKTVYYAHRPEEKL